ncbi:lipoprotein 17-related variable surface protein [Metamycoplasma equirhinis]|uniref:lipoprotein 17-related variable surface protein n=1 Tax=Metamycoplasma equirhinis TaxID=92402 RepID=UPI0035930870
MTKLKKSIITLTLISAPLIGATSLVSCRDTREKNIARTINNLNSQLNKVEIFLNPTINKKEKLASEITLTDLITKKDLPENIFVRFVSKNKDNISPIEVDDKAGSLVIEYYLETKNEELNEWIQSKHLKQKIEGFKTLKDLANKDLETVNLTIDESQKSKYLPSEYAKINKFFTFTYDNSKYELLNEKKANDEKGILEVIYWIKNKNTQVESKKESQTFSNFVTKLDLAKKEATRKLNEKIKSINLNELLNVNPLSLLASKITSNNFKKIADHIINIEKLEANDQNGKLKVTFSISSENPELKDVKSNSITVEIIGFLTTEQSQSKEKTDDLLEAQKKLDEAITKKEIEYEFKLKDGLKKEELSPDKITSENFTLSLKDNKYELVNLQLLPNTETGKLTITFKVQTKSEKFHLNVISSNEISIEIQGFLTKNEFDKNEELKKLNLLVAHGDLLVSVKDKDKFSSSEIKAEDFKFSSKYDSEVLHIALIVESLENNKETGEITINFLLKSEKEGFSDIQVKGKQKFSFMLDEQKRVNTIFESLKIGENANYLPTNVHKYGELETYFKNNEELAKILGIWETISKANVDVVIKSVNFFNKYVKDKLVIEFHLMSKANKTIVSKTRKIEISVLNFGIKKNLENFLSQYKLNINNRRKSELENYDISKIDDKEKFIDRYIKEDKSFATDLIFSPKDLIIQKTLLSIDAENGSVKIKVTMTFEDVSKEATFTVSGFATKSQLEKISKESEIEKNRLNEELKKIEIKYIGENQKFLDPEEIRDSQLLISKSQDAVFYTTNKKFNTEKGELTLTFKLKSSKKGFSHVESTERELIVSGFSKFDGKKYIEEIKKDFLASKEYADFKSDAISKANAKIDQELVGKKKELIEATKAGFEKSFLDLANGFILSATKTVKVLSLGYGEREELKKLYSELNKLISSTSEEYLSILLQCAKGHKTQSESGITYDINLGRDWILSTTVGVWATKIFNEISNSTETFKKLVDIRFEEFKDNSLLSKDKKTSEIKKLGIATLEYILEYYKHLNWQYLIHGQTQEVQPDYNGVGPGKVNLLTNGWTPLFNVEKFYKSQGYINESGNDLYNKLDKFIADNNLKKEDKEPLYKLLHEILWPITNCITIYNPILRDVLQNSLLPALKQINNAK